MRKVYKHLPHTLECKKAFADMTCQRRGLLHHCAIWLLHLACFSFPNCSFLVSLLYSALLSKGPFKGYGRRPPYILASTENDKVFIAHSCRKKASLMLRLSNRAHFQLPFTSQVWRTSLCKKYKCCISEVVKENRLNISIFSNFPIMVKGQDNVNEPKLEAWWDVLYCTLHIFVRPDWHWLIEQLTFLLWNSF